MIPKPELPNPTSFEAAADDDDGTLLFTLGEGLALVAGDTSPFPETDADGWRARLDWMRGLHGQSERRQGLMQLTWRVPRAQA